MCVVKEQIMAANNSQTTIANLRLSNLRINTAVATIWFSSPEAWFATASSNAGAGHGLAAELPENRRKRPLATCKTPPSPFRSGARASPSPKPPNMVFRART